jgi:hypothetical protein
MRALLLAATLALLPLAAPAGSLGLPDTTIVGELYPVALNIPYFLHAEVIAGVAHGYFDINVAGANGPVDQVVPPAADGFWCVSGLWPWYHPEEGNRYVVWFQDVGDGVTGHDTWSEHFAPGATCANSVRGSTVVSVAGDLRVEG